MRGTSPQPLRPAGPSTVISTAAARLAECPPPCRHPLKARLGASPSGLRGRRHARRRQILRPDPPGRRRACPFLSLVPRCHTTCLCQFGRTHSQRRPLLAPAAGTCQQASASICSPCSHPDTSPLRCAPGSAPPTEPLASTWNLPALLPPCAGDALASPCHSLAKGATRAMHVICGEHENKVLFNTPHQFGLPTFRRPARTRVPLPSRILHTRVDGWVRPHPRSFQWARPPPPTSRGVSLNQTTSAVVF